jgi:hypothetical protein
MSCAWPFARWVRWTQQKGPRRGLAEWAKTFSISVCDAESLSSGTIEDSRPRVNSSLLPSNCRNSSREPAMPGRNGEGIRRSGRVTLPVPLKVYEPGSNKRFLVEEACALKVSLWGGLVCLKTTVNRAQKLFLVNQATGESAESRVAYLGPMHLGGRRLRLVAIEFLRPSPNFWGLAFPTIDPSRTRSAHYSH